MKNFSILKYIQYSSANDIDISVKKVKDELQFWLENCNDYLYNTVDCEKLIYFENKYTDNLEIQELIEKLKNKISFNYSSRKRLISRLKLDKTILDA